MSLSKQSQVAADTANQKHAGNLWNFSDLPYPLNTAGGPTPEFGVGTMVFRAIVMSFQSFHGLLVDGILGPETYATMKSISTPVDGGESAHDFEEVDADDALDEDHSPARPGMSNCLIINGESVPLFQEMVDAGITASNYADDGELQFTGFRKRTQDDVRHFVIHESVTMSASKTNRVLIAKRNRSIKKGKRGGAGWDYGIHLNLSADGHISCHADLATHRLVHASQLNQSSVGIEVVNPYNPKFGRGPFTEIIPGEWWTWKPRGAKKVYTLPTDRQMRAIFPLCQLLADHLPGLPLSFPTESLSRKQPRIKNWREKAKPAPGIVAHRDFDSHADGRYLLEHCIRMSKANS